MELRGKYVMIAEGVRGSLAKQLRFGASGSRLSAARLEVRSREAGDAL